LGIATWTVEGAILASNDAFLRMVQYDHEDVAAGRRVMVGPDTADRPPAYLFRGQFHFWN